MGCSYRWRGFCRPAAILVSDELLPSEVLALDRKKLLGLVTWHGSVDSHTAMLLRLLNIPGLAQANISQDCDGHHAILDGFSQNLYLDPGSRARRPIRKILLSIAVPSPYWSLQTIRERITPSVIRRIRSSSRGNSGLALKVIST